MVLYITLSICYFIFASAQPSNSVYRWTQKDPDRYTVEWV